MQVSFYVLTDSTVSSSTSDERLLDFVCKLTQTVLQKSELSLVIIDDNEQRLSVLDTRLWSFDALSFIPHSYLPTKHLSCDHAFNVSDSTIADNQAEHDWNDVTAPVLLTAQLPSGFDGVVLNLAAEPLMTVGADHSDVYPARILEIIAPDELSKQQGRSKYQHYQQQGATLTYHPIS